MAGWEANTGAQKASKHCSNCWAGGLLLRCMVPSWDCWAAQTEAPRPAHLMRVQPRRLSCSSLVSPASSTRCSSRSSDCTQGGQGRGSRRGRQCRAGGWVVCDPGSGRTPESSAAPLLGAFAD